MDRKLVTTICVVTSLVVVLVACGPAPTNTPTSTNTAVSTTNTSINTEASRRTPPADLETLAQRLVNQSAGVKENDIVLISGGARDMELLEDIAVQVRKLGAHPLVTLSSDQMAKRLYTDVPEKYDSQAPALDLKLADTVNVLIGVDSNEAEGLFADADPKRLAARGKASEPVGARLMRNNVRLVNVGNNLYPTEWRARRYGMSLDELSNTFWGGVNVDYSSLQEKGKQVRAVIAAGNEVHVTNPSGTDLKLRIQGRPVVVSDGIISPEDMQKGGPNVSIYLPAGEVACSAVPGTASGKVVVPIDYYQDKEIQNLTLTFEGGKLISMTGNGPGFEPYKAAYEATGAGKELFGYIDFGINPHIRLAPGSRLGNWVPAGMVTVGTGNDVWAGGDNNVAGGVNAFLPGCTVTLDGRTVVENGQLKI